MAMAARIAMMATTTIISIRVKPLWARRMGNPLSAVRRQSKDRRAGATSASRRAAILGRWAARADRWAEGAGTAPDFKGLPDARASGGAPVDGIITGRAVVAQLVEQLIRNQ